MSNKFYITTPIYYVNDNPHIGHTYTTVASDILARFHRMLSQEVFFSTGTDEHGAKIQEKADEAGKEPQVWADEISANFQFAWDELNISHNRFIRTTEAEHKQAVQKALQQMYDQGDIYLGEYEGLYCQGCEQYKSETDLVDGKCPDHKVEPEIVKEESYMFKMSKYQDRLYEAIKKDELEIRPVERKNEVLSFYEREGLKDISFSRKKVKWGIPLPWDESHTAYVWTDAFLNYLTVLDWDGTAGQAPKMWPAEVQVMSKDILRVHATIWPAMLLSLGLDLPKKLFVHGFFLVDGQKMSKSLGNVVTPAALKEKYGVDGTRALLIGSASFGYDGDVSWEKFGERYNAQLANGIGNLVSRVLSLTEKNLEGKVPEINPKECGEITLRKEKKKGGDNFLKLSKETKESYVFKMEKLELDEAWEEVIKLTGHLDKHISDFELWKLIKEDKEEGTKHLYSLLESIRQLAWLAWPFIPETAEKIWTSLGLDPGEEMSQDFDKALSWGELRPGTTVNKGEPLFPRLS